VSSLNWADLVKDAGEATGNFEPLPDGDYDLKVVEAPAGTTSTGKTMFKLKAQITSGPYANRFIWDNITISPENKNALGIFFSKMAALGIPREFFLNNNPSNAQIEATIQGRVFRAQIGSEVYQGAKKNKIARYYVSTAAPVSTPPATPYTMPANTAGAAVPPPPPAPPAPGAVSAPDNAPF
jgi:hypothetical protein